MQTLDFVMSRTVSLLISVHASWVITEWARFFIYINATTDYSYFCMMQESRTLEMNNVQDGTWHGRGDTICIGGFSEGSKALYDLHPPPLVSIKSTDKTTTEKSTDASDSTEKFTDANDGSQI